MSMLLTTGQLMDLVRYLDKTVEYLAGSEGVAAAYIVKHDDALRQQLAETQAHLDAQRQATYRAVEREHAAKRQLAEVTQELERTKSAMASEYEMDMNDQIRQRKVVEAQLAEAQAVYADRKGNG